MRYEHAYYLTKDRSLEVEFLLLHLGPARGWRAYILSDINYKRVSPTRSTAIYDIHRLTETRGERYIDAARPYPYVCWNQTIHDLDTMKNVCAVWSEITAYYIRHGGSFSSIQRKLSAQGVI